MAKPDIFSDLGKVFALDDVQTAIIRKHAKKATKFVGKATDTVVDIGARLVGATVAAAGTFISVFNRRK